MIKLVSFDSHEFSSKLGKNEIVSFIPVTTIEYEQDH